MSSIGIDPQRTQRRQMVQSQIRARGITDPRVLEAMETVPRERFVLPEDAASAFADCALSIACGQTISQPYMVASMTDALHAQPHHRILEIGTGSGYQAAILARLAAHVYTIERLAPLQEDAERLLKQLSHSNISYRVGDGSLGWPEEAPFDGIIVTAGAPRIPQALIDQLADNGRIIAPVGGRDVQTLEVVSKHGSEVTRKRLVDVRFVSLIGQHGWSG